MRQVHAVLAAMALLVSAAGANDDLEVADPSPVRFDEVGEAAGARWDHHLRKYGEGHAAEVMEVFTVGGSTVAVGDWDGDGWDDLFLTDSALGRPHHLLRNTTGATGTLSFEPAAEAHQVAAGNDDRSVVSDSLWFDYDRDGWLDLLVLRFGTPLLYRNLGADGTRDARFVEVSDEVGLVEFQNSIAAIAVDVDADGWLDLVLGHYFAPHRLLPLEDTHIFPADLDQTDDGGGITLWHNVAGADGSRRFEASDDPALHGSTGWTLDVGHGDFDSDGDQDLYIAVDFGTDRFYRNRGDGTFDDDTEAAIGIDTRKGMNVEVADYDRDGELDVFVTNITDDTMRECNMLLQNLGGGHFRDVSRETGVCDSDWGWAGKFADFANDGWLDLFTVNGLRSAGEESYLPLLVRALVEPGADFADLYTYPAIGDRSWSGYQPTRLFENRGGTFADIAAEAGVDRDLDGRGLGIADYDRDGFVDVLQTNAGQPSLLFRNVSESEGRWIQLELVGEGGEPGAAIGARVTIEAGGIRWVREIDGGNGYASQSSRRLHVGLGDIERIERIEVRWPNGEIDRWVAPPGGSAMPIDTASRLRAGSTSSR